MQSCVYNYYQAAVILVGTINLLSDDFDTWRFIKQLQNYLLYFHYKFGFKHVVVLGFLPRAYCKMKNCEISQCLYLHRGHSKNLPTDLNFRIHKVNKAIGEFIKFDTRFKSFRFADFEYKINKLGKISNSYGNFLSKDGLHLSDSGNKLFDKWLFKYLSEINW